MREVRGDPAFLDDPRSPTTITSVGQRLLSVADNPPRDITFFMVQDGQHQRLRHGRPATSFIHNGLAALTQTNPELAGVMAHELSHIPQKHQARMIAMRAAGSGHRLAALALALLASRSNSRLERPGDGSRARRRHGL